MGQASASIRSWTDEPQTVWGAPLSLALMGSLLLHAGMLLVATWFHLPRSSEKPLASVEVTLVPDLSPPSQPSAAQLVEPPNTPVKSLPKPTQAKTPAAPTSPRPVPIPPSVQEAPVKVSPAPSHVVPSPASEPVQQSVAQDMPKSDGNDQVAKLDLPPEVPPLGTVSPPAKPVKRSLKLPDVPSVSPLFEPSSVVVPSAPRSSLVEESKKELERELKNLRNVELPPLSSFDPPPKAILQLEATAASANPVETTLRITGKSRGSNTYLGRIRQRINSFWVAPPIDVTGQTYVVVVRFRLHRDGSVSEVGIERSSGNEYYDLAGQRAVLSARPFPPFPAEVTESHYDVYFTFVVGESRGEG
ncbi:MAG: TonB family protein [Nitrospira sp.]|nr:TonB family protein [Nitrospira sp.]